MAAIKQPITLSLPGLYTAYEFFEGHKDLKALYKNKEYRIHYVTDPDALNGNVILQLVSKDRSFVQLELFKNSLEGSLNLRDQKTGETFTSLQLIGVDPSIIQERKLHELLPSITKQVEIIATEKLKGEIDGEFKMLYVGRDHSGNYYQGTDMVDAAEGRWQPLPEKEYIAYRNELYSLPILPHQEKDSDSNILDLFEHPDRIPPPVQEVLDRFALEESTYESCADLVKELNKIGYTCDYYLDAEPYNLRPLENTDRLIELETQPILPNNLNNTIMATEKKEEVHLSGYIGKDGVKINEYTDKKRATFQIGISSGDKTEWHQIQAWGKQAEKVAGLQTGAKVTIHGFNDSYTPDSGKTFEYVKANSIDLHLKQEKELVVSSFYTETPKNKEIGHLIGYSNYIEGGESKSDKIYIDVYGKNLDNLKTMNPEKGDKIKVEYDSKLVDGKEKTFENNVLLKAEMLDKKLDKAAEKAEEKQEAKAETKEAAKGAKKATKAAKGKDAGMDAPF